MKKEIEKTTNNINQKGGYGLLSLMAMIIGIVIGSGIFVKNGSLLSVNGDVGSSLIAWLIGSLIVIAILISFLEIISITEIADEQATLSNWGRHLLGIKFGKSMGYYVTLVYFPLIIAGLMSFAGDQFLSTLEESGAIKNHLTGMNRELAIIGITIIIILIISLMNTFTVLPGKYLQNIGTTIKTIPLIFVIGLFLFLVISNSAEIDFNQTIPDDMISAENKGIPKMGLIFMTVPLILFSFDGFLLAGSLSKEAKSPTLFKTAFVSSLLFIILIYVLFSVAIFGVGTATQVVDLETGNMVWEHGAYGTITNAIFAGIENEKAAAIISPIVSGIIVISIVTGASGCFIASSRMLSDLSAHNALLDKKMKYITKNKYGVSTSSGKTILALILFWFLIALTFDSLLISNNPNLVLPITGYMTDLIVIGSFTTYVIVIFGALKNRFVKEEKRVEVKKNIFFIPAAIISITLTMLITLFFAFTTLTPFAVILGAEWSSAEWTIYWAKLIFFVMFIIYTITIISSNLKRTNNIEEDLIKSKALQKAIYYGEKIEENPIQKNSKLEEKEKNNENKNNDNKNI